MPGGECSKYDTSRARHVVNYLLLNRFCKSGKLLLEWKGGRCLLEVNSSPHVSGYQYIRMLTKNIIILFDFNMDKNGFEELGCSYVLTFRL